MDEFNAIISALRTELAVNDATIARIQQENQQLKVLMANLSARNKDILQESKRDNLIISGFTPTFAEATVTGNDASAPLHTIVNKIEFCHNALNFPDVSAQDISSAYFLSLVKPVPGRNPPARMLVVQFTRRAVRDEVLASCRLLKAFNQRVNGSYFINEDLIIGRCKLFGEARAALKADKISGTWSTSGVIYVKLVSDRITPIHNSEELHNVITA